MSNYFNMNGIPLSLQYATESTHRLDVSIDFKKKCANKTFEAVWKHPEINSDDCKVPLPDAFKRPFREGYTKGAYLFYCSENV